MKQNKGISVLNKRHFAALLSLLLIAASPTPIKLQKELILSNRIGILLPSGFESMPQEMINARYPSERRPDLVYTDETGAITLSFMHTVYKASPEQIDVYHSNFVSLFKSVYPTADWKGAEVKQINGQKVGYVEFITPAAADTRIYSLMFFTDVEGKFLLCTFRCDEEQHEYWMASAQQIMNSLTIFPAPSVSSQNILNPNLNTRVKF